MDGEEEIEGFQVVVEALKNLGVKYIFGVVGIPVVEVTALVGWSFLHRRFFSIESVTYL